MDTYIHIVMYLFMVLLYMCAYIHIGAFIPAHAYLHLTILESASINIT